MSVCLRVHVSVHACIDVMGDDEGHRYDIYTEEDYEKTANNQSVNCAAPLCGIAALPYLPCVSTRSSNWSVAV